MRNAIGRICMKGETVNSRIVVVRVCGAIALSALLFLANGCRAPDALSLWNDGTTAKRAIVEYVSAVTDESSPDFIPPERRIAVFDLDGTLFCETNPTYFDWLLFEHRVLDDPSFRATDEQKAAAIKARKFGKYPPLGKERERLIAEAYRGLTLDELDAIVGRFMDEPSPGYAGMRRGEMFYAPMVQLVAYLAERGFSVYVVSGSDRFVVRTLVRGTLPVPPWRVIGSDSLVVSRTQDGKDGLFYIFGKDDVPVLDGAAMVKNLQMNKVSAMIREIGVKPVIAFGNSVTDASMANYVVGGNEYRALAFMVICDDERREHGNAKKAADMRRACGESGWVPISMHGDWKSIYERGAARQ